MRIISLGVLVGVALLIAQPLMATEEPARKDPEAVAAAVTQALRATREINVKNISVTTHAGTIVLSGSVATEQEAARAVAVAEKTAAGVRVSSGLEVDASQAEADPASMQLLQDVAAALKKDARTANLGITVSIDEQKSIQLHGLVPSRQDRATAQTVAAQVKGVTKVDNRLLTPAE